MRSSRGLPFVRWMEDEEERGHDIIMDDRHRCSGF